MLSKILIYSKVLNRQLAVLCIRMGWLVMSDRICVFNYRLSLLGHDRLVFRRDNRPLREQIVGRVNLRNLVLPRSLIQLRCMVQVSLDCDMLQDPVHIVLWLISATATRQQVIA